MAEEDVILKKIGKRIRAKRLERNLSQQDLADKCGIEKANLSRIESGQVNLKVLTLRRIAQALRTRVRDIWV